MVLRYIANFLSIFTSVYLFTCIPVFLFPFCQIRSYGHWTVCPYLSYRATMKNLLLWILNIPAGFDFVCLFLSRIDSLSVSFLILLLLTVVLVYLAGQNKKLLPWILNIPALFDFVCLFLCRVDSLSVSFLLCQLFRSYGHWTVFPYLYCRATMKNL